MRFIAFTLTIRSTRDIHMRPLFCAVAVALSAGLATHSVNADDRSDLAAILDRVDDLYIDKASHATLTMHIVTSHATRDLSMESWTKRDKILVRILAPEKERGTATLKSGGNVWNYFPKINQVTKVSASLMSASWMGSHLTNGELVKQVRMTEGYTYVKTFEGDRGGESVIELTLDPKPNAAVVWGRLIVTVRNSDKNPMQIKYFDEARNLAQTLTFSNVRRLGGRDLPSVLTIVPSDKPTESTEVRYGSIEFNLPMNDELFSLRTLQK
jgi:outer membrane lipoprotein-sorting protein